jgi:hypothetical protein
MAESAIFTAVERAKVLKAADLVLLNQARLYPPTLRRPAEGGTSGTLLRSAKLVTRTALTPSGARWAYNCRLGKITAANAWVEDVPQTNIVVWNKFELTMVPQLFGVQPDGVDQRTTAGYPQGYRLLPIGGGTDATPANLAILTVWQESLADGSLHWFCDRVLAHFGTC